MLPQQGINQANRSMGLLRVMTPEETTMQRTAEYEDRQNDPLISGLSAHIRKRFDAAVRAKDNEITQRLLKCDRQRKGIYEPDMQGRIDAQGGTDVFMMLTDVKCRAAESWLKDVMLPAGERPFNIEPTPIPKLAPEVEEGIYAGIIRFFNQAIAQGRISPQEFDTQGPEQFKRLKKEFLQTLTERAEECADDVTRKVNDDLTEGRWYEALSDILEDICTYPAAFMEGPIRRKRKVLRWGPDGRPEVQEVVVQEYERFSPYDAFPSPGAKSVQDGYFCRRIYFSRTDVENMIGVKGFSDDAVRLVLDTYPDGYREKLSYDHQRNTLEDTQDYERDPDGKYECIKFWGSVPGTKILEFDPEADFVDDPFKSYTVIAYIIGNYTVSMRLNSHPLGKRNIFSASYKEKSDSIWGECPPEMMRDIQRMCNACARALADNMSIASGPQVWGYVDRLPAGEQLESMYPWKIWKLKSNPQDASSRQPMGFFQPNSNASELIQIYDYYFKQASEVTGIPAYIYGSENVGGAGKTASGLSMLMNAAAKGLKAVAGHIDAGIIKPSVKEHWTQLMLNDPEQATGDINVIARASDHLVIAEQLQMRRIEYLQMTANPIDSQIIPPEGRAELHRETAKSLKMPVDKIIPDRKAIIQNTAEAKLKEMVTNLAGHLGLQPDALYQMAMQPAKQKPQSLLPDGSPAGRQVA